MTDLTEEDKLRIEKAVAMVVEQYGETLRLLAND